MIPSFFLKDNCLKTRSLGVLINIHGGIQIPPAPDNEPAFSGSMKIPCPMTVCNMSTHVPGGGSAVSCTGKKIQLREKQIYSLLEV
jgi:hypothetical protein